MIPRATTRFARVGKSIYAQEDIQAGSEPVSMNMQFRANLQVSKNSIFVSTVNLADVLFPLLLRCEDFFETNEVPSDEPTFTVILGALKNRDSKTCIEAYTKLIEDLISMYRQLQSKEAVTQN
jgi:hypothetical protein